MKSTRELRIGNIVSINRGFEVYVDGIHKERTVYLDFKGNEGDVFEEYIEDVEGIPLTKESILRLGFTLEAKGDCNAFLSPSFGGDRHKVAFITNDCAVYSLNIFTSLRIMFLHELQNLIYTLEREELVVDA